MKHFKIDFKQFKSAIKNVSPATLLAIYFCAALLVPNFLLDITENYSLLAKLTNIILPAGIYLLLLYSLKRIGLTVILMLPFIIFAAWQIVLLYLYGESIIAVDMYLNVLTTNPDEATELLANLGPAIITVVVLYVPALIWATVLLIRHINLPDETRVKIKRIGLIVAGGGVLLMGLTYVVDRRYSLRRHTFPINVIYNIKLAVDEGVKIHKYPSTSKDFTYSATPTHPTDSTEIYILIIGETSRGGNWQLGGYERATNPQLSKRDGIAYFRHAISESNTTHKSVPLLLSSLNAENYDSVNYHKSLITAFKEAGFHTTFISNQAPNRSYTEYFSYEADSTIYLPAGPSGRDYDGKMIAQVDRCLQDSVPGPRLMVLHGYGSHFKYSERYPEEYSVFQPDECKSASYSNRGTLINAYDNSILYTDAWLDSLFSVIGKYNYPAAAIYVSDHGEDIMDDSRKRFLHASPTPTFHQIHVGMLAWTSPEFRELYPDKTASLDSHTEAPVNSSVSVFHTILDLAGINTPRFDAKESLASEKYSPAPYRYLNDLNEATTLEESGLKEIDIKLLIPHLSIESKNTK